jgi:hypothetical protein
MKGVVFFSDLKKKERKTERKGIRRNKCVHKTSGGK